METKDAPKVDEKGETTHVTIKDKINEDAVTKPNEETPTIEKIGDSLKVGEGFLSTELHLIKSSIIRYCCIIRVL